jgi:hypothetical protein
MFNHGRADGEDDEGADGTTAPSATPAAEESTGAGPATAAAGRQGPTLEEMMRRLDEMSGTSASAHSDSLEELAEQASAHASALRATLDAEKEAQRMLALATRVRGEAATRAEQILLEARAVADRLREESERQADLARAEFAEWAAVQRRTLEQGVADVLEAARSDAENIRVQALRTAMSEAERTAQQYVDRATAAGAEHAEAIRADARALLGESSTMLAESEQLLHRFADEVGSFMVSLQRQFDAAKELSGRARERTTAAASVGLHDLGLEEDEAAPGESTTPPAADDVAGEPEPRASEDGDADARAASDAEGPDAAPDTAPDTAPATTPDAAPDAATAETEAGAAEQPTTGTSTPPRMPHQRRPLGSLFQPPESED